MAADMADPNSDEFYVRRLDRSPEHDNSNLGRITDGDRQKIYSLRNMFGEKITKIQHLEDSLTEKDLAIEREKELRMNLESKLLDANLIDMYGNPAVNEELHERLPRASKHRRFSLTDETPKSRKGKLNKKKKSSAGTSESSDSDDTHPHIGSFPGAPYFSPPVFVTPGYPGIVPGMVPSAQQSTPVSQSYPLNAQPSNFVFLPSWQSGNTKENPSQWNLSAEKSNHDKQNSDIIMQSASLLTSEGKDRQIARLLQEIDLLKDQNMKMSYELAEISTECEKLKTEKELMGVSNEEQISSRVSVIIQEIYQKQKQRDQAMMNRLKLANEERDQSIMMMNSMREGRSLHLNANRSEEDMKNSEELLNSMGIDIDQSDVIESIHGAVQRSKELSSQRFSNLTEEKKKSDHKVKKLEEELAVARKEVEGLIGLQQENAKLKKQLSNTQYERDVAMDKLKQLGDENNQLRIYYGLHKSLSKEQSWRDQYNNSLNQMEQLIAQRDGHMLDAQKETNKLQEFIQELVEERDMLSQQLEKQQHLDIDYQKTNEKLQRHVNVLQKKLKKLSVEQDDTV